MEERGGTHEWFNLRFDSPNNSGQSVANRGLDLMFLCDVLGPEGDGKEEYSVLECHTM
jgi:hypothetical protein